ncbi:C25 family cysteine peptidase [Dyadobacter sp. CY326]|uniref:putative type IX secretion system sortase PorU2 n=1 Tax=Dyadobacter sp. CY326 TaxID=2907300 RepID=UPI001F1FCF08|nr:C25 family cysteine peptidase [Dyadobacter sp. CY326]MCE7067277.1 C25 family cysteine peptidase [Dyadobacter sp. CY326]
MRYKNGPLITLFLILATLLTQNSAMAQWNAPYANSWIDYNKPYVKLGIAKTGLHRVSFASLPKNFPKNAPEKLQLWRRGKQVAIISTTNNEVVFYAVTNDGASDSLLYRPMSSRINPYFSMYSDEGAYLLTVGDAPGLRAKTISQPVDNKAPIVPFHKEIAVTQFLESYSLSTVSAIKPALMNSFFEAGASKSGPGIKADSMIFRSFKLENFAGNVQKSKLKLLIHGRSETERKVEVYVGKDKASLRLVTTIKSSGFDSPEYTFELKPADIDAANSGILALKSVIKDRIERFSLTYFSIEFPQLIKLDNQIGKTIRLDPVKELWSRIAIQDASASFMMLDVTNTDDPFVIKGTPGNLMIPRNAHTQMLFAANKHIEVESPNIKEIKFKAFVPKEANYIIITTDSLYNGASKFAEYRSSPSGGSFKPLIANIKDIYDQFNYGEPSPVAIKKFMSYMLTEGGKDKYLFLIGKSITYNERMKRELPDEVPSIGYPASDALLVEGLAGAPLNMPAIPVGRLAALTNQNVLDYLQKVKDYEGNRAGQTGWAKNVLHLNGGKTASEITQLRENLEALEPMVSKGLVEGKVKQYVKQKAMAETEPVNITADINEGVGLLTYFGHGSAVVTDLDFGYATDAPRAYNNLHKYPVMYFNGCGVGNVFAARFNPKPKNPKGNDRIPLSLDWLLAPNMGAVAIIANSLESIVTPAAKYLERFYYYTFKDPKTVSLSIGKIQLAVANDIITNHNDPYAIGNVRQSVLQGDPALRLAFVDKPESTDPNPDNDHIAPLLTVKFNERLISQDEVIGLHPAITLHLSDDKPLLPDTALIDIFVKRCGDDNCDFEPVSFAKSSITVDSLGSKALLFRYFTDLGLGTYEILVNARDQSGNAVAQPYRIRFKISEEAQLPNELVVSPNPASDYLRFALKSPQRFNLHSVKFIIYNQHGVVIDEKHTSFPVWSLTNEWFWFPPKGITGIYAYKVFLINNAKETFDNFTGKVLLSN